MYIEEAFKGLHDFWRYVIGTVLTFIAWQLVGAVPLVAILLFKMFQDPNVSMNDMPSTIPDMVAILGENLFLFLMIVSFMCGLLGVLLSSRLLHKQSFLSLTTTRSKIDWKRIFVGFFLVVFVNLIIFGISYSMSSEGLVWNFKLEPFLVLLVIALLFLPFQTSFEEYLFRGYLMQGIGANLSKDKWIPLSLIGLCVYPLLYIIFLANFQLDMLTNLGISLVGTLVVCFILNRAKETVIQRKWVPLVFTSVIFGLMHAFNPEIEQLGYITMYFYIGTGFILGVMTLMDDGMELALGFHAGNNILTALLISSEWSALQTDALFLDTSEPTAGGFFDIILPVFVVYPLMIFVLGKIYKWKNWKEKLFGIVHTPNPDIEMQNKSQ